MSDNQAKLFAQSLTDHKVSQALEQISDTLTELGKKAEANGDRIKAVAYHQAAKSVLEDSLDWIVKAADKLDMATQEKGA